MNCCWNHCCWCWWMLLRKCTLTFYCVIPISVGLINLLAVANTCGSRVDFDRSYVPFSMYFASVWLIRTAQGASCSMPIPRTFCTESYFACLEQFLCFAALRSPEDLLSPAWPGVTGAVSAPGEKGAGGLSCLSLPRLMMALPGPGVVTAPPASQLPVLASSVHLETPPPPITDPAASS